MSGEQPAKLATRGRQGLLGQTHKTFQPFQPPAARQAFSASGGRARGAEGCPRLSGVATVPPGGGDGVLAGRLWGLTLGSNG